MRKQILAVLIGIGVLFGVAGNSHALLVDNGDGTVTQTRGDGSRLMWTKDANMAGNMTWNNAVAWAEGLNFAEYTDWRLPTVTDIGNDGCNFGYSGTDCGYNVDTSTSEMAYMYHTELDNLSFYDTSGNIPAGSGLLNRGPFTNMQSNFYWSGTPNASMEVSAWYFYFTYGNQTVTNINANFYAWAVRPGDVSDVPDAVPEPGTILLLGSGLAGLVIYRRKISI